MSHIVRVGKDRRRARQTRIFLCINWGAAGSHWLSRALNAHPDILCLHVPFSSVGPERDKSASLDFTEFLLGQGDHDLLGYTHGVSVEWIPAFRAHFGSSRVIACHIERHPLPRIRSMMALDHGALRHIRQTMDWWQRGVEQAKRHLSDADEYFPMTFDDKSFYRSVVQTNTIVGLTRMIPRVFKIEDLSSYPAELDHLVEYLSGGVFSYPEALAREVQELRISVHAGGEWTPRRVWDSWPDHWRRAFPLLMHSNARATYLGMGYELYD